MSPSLPPQEVIFGSSDAMQAMRRRVEKIAGINVPVLIHGESGTGKELIARLVHEHSPWASGPLVKVNCPAIPGTLLESELFGYEKGAFTGAYGSKPGRVEMAHRGTLFLDEISELAPGLQAKLLQLLQDGQFCRIGGHEDTKVEVRVVCATNRDLAQEIDSGSFRADLFYRINVVTLHLPPLRDRIQDVPMLTSYFLEHYATKYSCPLERLSQRTISLMQRYYWPGNVRELENLIKRFVILGNEETIMSELLAMPMEHVDPELVCAGGPIALKQVTRQAVNNLEKRIIFKVLQAHNWNRKKAARNLSISYRALLYKMRGHGFNQGLSTQ